MDTVSEHPGDTTTVPTRPPWSPSGWRDCAHVLQQPDWPDHAAVEDVVNALSAAETIVSVDQVDQLRADLAMLGQQRGLILQAGDCAEAFVSDARGVAEDFASSMMTLADGLQDLLHVPVMPIGRVGGQYAKPRSARFDVMPDGSRLPAFRGHIVNDPAPTACHRSPDPTRMLVAYHQAREKAQVLMRAGRGRLVWMSHEALLLPYEEALTRVDARTNGHYALSAHMLWVGERTRALDSAHVDFLAGIANPIGCKVGPEADSENIADLARVLNPAGDAGKLCLIPRLGAGRVRECLPRLVDAVTATTDGVTWICDPMHGNTMKTRSGRRTRPVDAILDEVEAFCSVLMQLGVRVGGLHLELTPDTVSECADASVDPYEHDAGAAFTSLMDPRLNISQAKTVLRHFADCVKV